MPLCCVSMPVVLLVMQPELSSARNAFLFLDVKWMYLFLVALTGYLSSVVNDSRVLRYTSLRTWMLDISSCSKCGVTTML